MIIETTIDFEGQALPAVIVTVGDEITKLLISGEDCTELMCHRKIGQILYKKVEDYFDTYKMEPV